MPILTASYSAVGALLLELPREIAQCAALTVVALATWAEPADYSAESRLWADVAADLGHLSTEMRALWFGIDEAEPETAASGWRDLQERGPQATRRVPADRVGHSGVRQGRG